MGLAVDDCVGQSIVPTRPTLTLDNVNADGKIKDVMFENHKNSAEVNKSVS